MKFSVLPFVLSLLASPALALSCLPADVATSFKEAAASEKRYVVVHGALSFDESELPEADMSQQDQNPPDVDIAARLTGRALSTSGFETDFDHPVTLRAQCFGPWCGRASSDTDYLAFLEKSDDGYVLAVTPCGGYEFAEPTDAMLKKAVQCFNGEACAPGQVTE